MQTSLSALDYDLIYKNLICIKCRETRLHKAGYSVTNTQRHLDFTLKRSICSVSRKKCKFYIKINLTMVTKFFSGLGIKFSTSHLLHKCSTTSHTPVLLVCFSGRVLHFYMGLIPTTILLALHPKELGGWHVPPYRPCFETVSCC